MLIEKKVSPDFRHTLHLPDGYTISQYDASNINYVMPGIEELWQDPEIIHNCGGLSIRDEDNIFITIRNSRTQSVCGCIQIGSDKDKILGIFQLAIERNHRSKGFAQLLMKMAENYAAAIKCSQLMLLVRKSNTKGLSFYSKYGFEKSDINPDA